MPNYVLLNPAQHQGLKITASNDFAFCQQHHHCPLVVHEFGSAASSFPVIYLKDSQQGQFRAVGLLSLITGHNSFYCDQQWTAVHVPYAYTRIPFELGPDPEQDKTLTVYLDLDSEAVNENHGEALYENGQATQFLQKVEQKMLEYYQQEQLSHRFTQQLLTLNLLQEMELLLEFADGKISRLKGLYTINEQALRQLSDEQILALNQQNFLLPIHAMLTSLVQVNRLIKQHNSRSDNTISGVKMRVIAEEN